MTFDVACAGAVYLDLTFVGLNGVPLPGEEQWAEDLVVSPGGMANTAIGLARLGLSVAVVSPMGEDLAGQYLRGMLEAEGIACTGPRATRSAVTAVLPINGDRALASFAPVDADRADGLREVNARAAVLLVDHMACAPTGIPVYVLTSHAQVHAASLGNPTPITRAHALMANTSEALALTGTNNPHAAVQALAKTVDTAVVTLGASGALAASGQTLTHAAAPTVDVRDATGAGDLFAAGYIWADLLGHSLEDRLRWATLYASLSLRTVTAYAGARTRAQLELAAHAVRW
jgi:sugar/nucleoside kinase (ribokinase family)